jgi:uncharacterized protein (UPF0212 family)
MKFIWLTVILIILALIIIIIAVNRTKKVMVDKYLKCPHCGKEIDAAFINNKLAMERKCPHCGKVIK